LVGRTGVKLLDFGIAKIAHSSAEVITARGVAIGTPRYMSPEQARGEAVDGRADLYATGLILFEMVSGVGPFDDAKDANELLLAHLSKEAPQVSWAVPGVPAEVDAIISRLLAKQPTARPVGAGQVASTLRAIASRVMSVSSSAPTPVARQGAPNAPATDASISAVPTNRLHGAAEEKTYVPPGGFTQVAPTDPNPTPALASVHSMRTVSDPIGGATTQFETPRVGTPEQAAQTPERVSIGSAPPSAAYEQTEHAPPASGSLGDTLHSPSISAHAPDSGARSRFDRTLRIDEVVPLPPDSGVATRTAVPLPEAGETPPPVESYDRVPAVPRPKGVPAWIPIVASLVIISAVVALATWMFLGVRRSPSSEVAAPAPPPPAEPAPVELKPPVAIDQPKSAPSAAAAAPSPGPSPTRVAAPAARARVVQPSSEAAKTSARQPDPVPQPEPAKASPPTSKPKPTMPGSGL
jgi:serine/threonine-protein kinase